MSGPTDQEREVAERLVWGRVLTESERESLRRAALDWPQRGTNTEGI